MQKTREDYSRQIMYTKFLKRKKMLDLLKFPVVKLHFNHNSFLSTLSDCENQKIEFFNFVYLPIKAEL